MALSQKVYENIQKEEQEATTDDDNKKDDVQDAEYEEK